VQVDGIHYHSIWFDTESGYVNIIDQTKLPHQFSIITLHNLDETCHAIKTMQLRGAPLIGAAAAFGIYLALKESPEAPVESTLQKAIEKLTATRPTAINLAWALNQLAMAIADNQDSRAEDIALAAALKICDLDIQTCSSIGDIGLVLLQNIHQAKVENERVVNILTHCNAGWLATVDWGTALAPIYKAHNAGIPVHVWVGETRPRNQGANLTAWELSCQNVPHTVISDNAGGHLMQQGMVDICLVGSDRTTGEGDVCNKIGTYQKALAAKDNSVPFYVALPISTIDWETQQIPIEIRDSEELTHIQGLNSQGVLDRLKLTPEGSPALNHAFDVTPGRLVSGLITELGIFSADVAGLNELKHQLKQQLLQQRKEETDNNE
jgi:methylthioribose-1-phosphate isomerase